MIPGLNGANCSVPVYRYRYQCKCRPGYEGYNCGFTVKDECASSPCQNGGKCIDGMQSYTCVCPNHYQLRSFLLDENCRATRGPSTPSSDYPSCQYLLERA